MLEKALENREEDSCSSESFEFFHATKERECLKSFLRQGAKVWKPGLYDREAGFFVMSKKDRAIEIFRQREAFIIGVKVPKKEVKYPLWQFDFECARPLVKKLFERYFEEVENIKYVYQDRNERHHIVHFKKRDNALELEDHHGQYISYGNVESETIALLDMSHRLCKRNEEFLADYNALLQEVMKGEKEFTKEGVAVKYTGKKPLLVSSVERIVCLKEGYKSFPIYKAEKKSDQVCPFVKNYILAKKARREV
ncbi:MAG: hypothetical protein EOM53_01190 [Alphaproteobacteria bacterium]|nr:hypothetical protein [Alphaproteobacteria bacterium]